PAVGDVLRRHTDARDLHKPDPGRLQAHLRRRGSGSSPEERSRSAERCRVQELASVHALSSFLRREPLPASGTEVNCSIFAPAAGGLLPLDAEEGRHSPRHSTTRSARLRSSSATWRPSWPALPLLIARP